MEERTGCKDIWCRMFCRALTRDVVAWYKTLSTGAIHTYEDLEKAFGVAFVHRRRRRKFRATLIVIKQGNFKSTREYMDRFASEVQKVESI